MASRRVRWILSVGPGKNHDRSGWRRRYVRRHGLIDGVEPIRRTEVWVAQKDCAGVWTSGRGPLGSALTWVVTTHMARRHWVVTTHSSTTSRRSRSLGTHDTARRVRAQSVTAANLSWAFRASQLVPTSALHLPSHALKALSALAGAAIGLRGSLLAIRCIPTSSSPSIAVDVIGASPLLQGTNYRDEFKGRLSSSP